MSELSNFIKSEKHLPYFLKDFHDQKDFFKALHKWIQESNNHELIAKCPNWVDGHVYTIDLVLAFFALHGYTLQKNKTKINFCDIHDTIARLKQEEIKGLQELLKTVDKKENK